MKDLSVSVVFARPDEQVIVPLEVAAGATLRTVIERSRIMETYPEIDLATNRVGVFGKLRDLGDTVQHGDRVEIYRALLIDPKEARRKNAAAAKKTKRAQIN